MARMFPNAITMPFNGPVEVREVAHEWRIKTFSTLPLDRGCELFPVCLECPLPYCIEEFEYADRIKYANGVRDALLMVDYRKSEMSMVAFTKAFAQATGVLPRTVYRRIANGKAWVLKYYGGREE